MENPGVSAMEVHGGNGDEDDQEEGMEEDEEVAMVFLFPMIPMTLAEMVSEIVQSMRRYQDLTAEDKAWVSSVYTPRALTEFLHQVNHIEGEGFDSIQETQLAIENGVLLEDGGWKQDDDRLEHVSCLHRALRTWFSGKLRDAHVKPNLATEKLLLSHSLLLETVDPDIAGRMRHGPDERVFVRTSDGEKHYFMEPEKVEGELVQLMNRSNRELRKILVLPDEEERVSRLLDFAGRFFYEYESIHPFMDGNGRTGRIMLARILHSITVVAPNILFVDKGNSQSTDSPPFVDRERYWMCFEKARVSSDCSDLINLITEGVRLGWRRMFESMERERQIKKSI